MSLDEKKPELEEIEHYDEKPSSPAHHAANGETKGVFNAAFAEATAETLNPYSKESRVLFFSLFVAFLCACANGYDGSLMSAILAMDHFQHQFNSGTTGLSVSLIFSMYTAGTMVGALAAGPISDRFGRRRGMQSGGIIINLGMVIIATSHRIPQLVVGRTVLGFGIAFMTVAAPSYAVEIAPPQWRGRMVGLYNCGWFGGAIPAAAICFGTSFMKSNLSWQLPLIFQSVPALTVIGLAFFIPESPRWLMANGREDEAHAFLVKYHGNKDPHSKLVALEWAEFKEGIVHDGSDKRWWDYRPLFNTKNGRWRMLCVLLMSIFGQFSGNGLGYFNVVIYENLGYTSVAAQLGLNLANQVVSAICAATGAFLSDKMPRRKVLISGTFASAAMLAVNAALSLKWAQQPTMYDATLMKDVVINPNLAIGQGALAAYFLFNGVFSFAYTPLQAAYPAECLESTSRAKGMALSSIIMAIMGFINQFAGPVALGTLANNYVFVFVGWDIVEAVIWYFACVETQGRTLEQLEEIFSAPNPVAASKRMSVVAIREGGDVVAVECA